MLPQLSVPNLCTYFKYYIEYVCVGVWCACTNYFGRITSCMRLHFYAKFLILLRKGVQVLTKQSRLVGTKIQWCRRLLSFD